MFRKTVDGVITRATRMSPNGSVINNGFSKLIATQCCLRLKEFWDLVDCTVSEDDWNNVVAERCASWRNAFLNR